MLSFLVYFAWWERFFVSVVASINSAAPVLSEKLVTGFSIADASR